MIIFTPNTVIKSADMNLNLSSIKNVLSGFDIREAHLAGNQSISMPTAWTLYDIPTASVSITPSVDCKAIIWGSSIIDKGSSTDQFTFFIRDGANNQIGNSWGELGPTVQYTTRTAMAKQSLAANTAYTFKLSVSRGSGSSSCIARYDQGGTVIVLLTIPDSVGV